MLTGSNSVYAGTAFCSYVCYQSAVNVYVCIMEYLPNFGQFHHVVQTFMLTF